MIYHIRSKYTAVGRKEIVMFFWLYAIIELLAIFLDSGIIPTANDVYPVRPRRLWGLDSMANSCPQWFAAVYTGLVAATYCCLLINAFVGFQFAEDGTPLSLWVRRILANHAWCRILTIHRLSDSLRSFYSVPASSSPSRHSKASPASTTQSLSPFGSSTLSGQPFVSSYTSSPSSSLWPVHSTTDGRLVISSSVPPSSLSPKLSSSPSA
jgi:hypothetical protein